MGWHHLGAWRGGTVAALLLASDGTTLVGATSAGVFALGTGGRWQQLGAEGPMSLITCLASSPAEPCELWAAGAGGVFHSHNLGGTWSCVLAGTAILSLAAVPDGAVVAGTVDEGVVRSDDRGRTWYPANGGLLELSVNAIAGTSAGHRVVAGTESGLYHSYNGGRSWRPVESVPDDVAVSCVGAVVPHILLAGTTQGLFRSGDTGASWHRVQQLGRLDISSLASFGDAVVVASGRDLYLSADRGQTWRLLASALEPVVSLALTESGRIYAGLTNRGVLTCTTDLPVWDTVDAGLKGVLPTSIAVAWGARGGDAVVATSAGGESIRSTNFEDRATRVDALLNSGDPRVTSAPGRPRVWAYGHGGLSWSDDGGSSWELVPGSPSIEAFAVIHANASQPRLVAATSGELLASDDGGANWTRVATVPIAGRVVDLVTSEAGSLFLLIDAASSPHREVWIVDGEVSYRCLGGATGESLSVAACTLPGRTAGCLVAGASAIHLLTVTAEGPSVEHIAAPPGMISTVAQLPGDHSYLVATDRGLFLTKDGGRSYSLEEGPGDLAPVLFIAAAPGHSDAVQLACLGGDIWTCHLSE